MNIPKSKRSSFFLIVFIITYFYILVCSFFSMAAIHESGVVLGDFNATVVLGTVVFAGMVTALLIYVSKKFRPEGVSLQTEEGKRKLEILIPIVIYALVLLGRGIYIALILGGDLSGESWIFGRVTDGRYSLIPGEMGFGEIGADWLYAVLMKPFCTLLGYNAVSVYVLNTLCQVATACCVYMLLKMLVGRAGATAFGCLFVCMPYFYECVSVCEPAHLMMLLVSLVLLLYVRNLKVSVLKKERKGEIARRYFMMGFLAGVLLFIDQAQIWLPIATLIFYIVNVKKKPIGVPMYLIGLFAGIFAILAAFGLMLEGGGTFLENGLVYFQESITLYEESLFSGDSFILFNHNPELLILIFLSGISIFLFFKSKHDPLRVMSVAFFLVIFVCAANLFQSGAFFVFYSVIVLIASMAYGMMFLPGIPLEMPTDDRDEQTKENKKEETQMPASRGVEAYREPPKTVAGGSLLRDALAADTGETMRTAPKPSIQYQEKLKTEEQESFASAQYQEKPKVEEQESFASAQYQEKPKAEEQESSVSEQYREKPKPKIAEAMKPEIAETPKEETSKEKTPPEKASAGAEAATGTEQKPKPRMIRNPLPVPPKHEHKKQDYAYDVPPNKMHYDVNGPEDDDYDRVRI